VRPSRRVPLLRGFVGATIATFVALASHVWVGGYMPGMLGIAVPWLLSLMACTLLAGHRLSLVRLSASVIISQLLFHVLFVLGSITPQGGLGPHVHGVVPLSFGGDAPLLLPQDAAMWFAHAVAAALTVAALHRGELIARALLTVARAVATWLSRAVPAVDVMRVVTPVRRRWAVLTAPRVREVHVGTLRRRGPPHLV